MKQSTAIATVIAVVVVAFFLGGLIYKNESLTPALVNQSSGQSQSSQSQTDQSQSALLSTTTTASAGNTSNVSSSTSSVATGVLATSNYPMETTSDGLQIQDISIGTGATAKAGDHVYVNYIGTLTNGTKFDSSYDRGQPIDFVLGVGTVIPGWDQGLLGMKVGGKRQLVIPPSLAYGNQAVGLIPANSTLVFQVELVKIAN
jgi:FKBP-type peptidyl-prolyl cis-trans isomerase